MQREIEQQQRASSKKSKKNKKKHKKKKGRSDTEEEDDLPVLHAVSNTMETPEVKAISYTFHPFKFELQFENLFIFSFLVSLGCCGIGS